MPMAQQTQVSCDQCDETLTVGSTSVREVREKAVERGWQVKGTGEQMSFTCPAHTTACPHCGQEMSSEVAKAARDRVRRARADRAAAREQADQTAAMSRTEEPAP